MKKRIIVASAAALALGVAGCSNGDTDGGNATADPTNAGEPVTIQYMHRLPDGEGMTTVAEIVERWNSENPDIQVEPIKFDGQANEMIQRLENEVNAGTAACLAQVGYAEVPSLFSRGLLEDVTEQAGQYADNFAEGAMGLMQVGGVGVGLPQDVGPLVYYYNEAEFEALGIEVPTTADELAEVAQTAAAQGKYAVSFQPDEAHYGLAAQAAAAGAQWYDASGEEWVVNVDSPETQLVTDFWTEVLGADAALVEQRWSDAFTASLVDQTLIGTIGAAWEAPLLADDMADTENVGQWRVAQLPAFGDEQMSGPNGGSGVAVMSGCEYPDQAMQFNDWFNTQLEDLATQGLVLAAVGDVETPEGVSEFYGGQDVMGELGQANEIMNPDFGYIPTWPALADPMNQAAAAAGNGTGEVSAIFEQAQTASVQSLQDAGLPVSE